MLGAAAQCKFQTALGHYAAVASPGAKRVQETCSHLGRIRMMIRARVHDEADQAICAVIQQSVAHGLCLRQHTGQDGIKQQLIKKGVELLL